MQGQVYIDGQYHRAEDAEISVFDRGLLIGDGVYEDIRVYGGRPFNLGGQLGRLERHVASAQLGMPLRDEPLVAVIHELLCRNHIGDGGIRVILTRGSAAGRGGEWQDEIGRAGTGRGNGNAHRLFPATTVIFAAGLDMFSRELPRSGIDVTVYGRGEGETPLPASPVKWLRQTGRVAAYNKIMRAGFPEALTVDQEGRVAGALYHAVFVVRRGDLLIPDMNGCHLGDTFREVIIDLAKGIGLFVREVKLSVDDLLRSDECFLSGFVTEIVPVTAVNGVMLGSGGPGKTTTLLSGHLERVIRELSGADDPPRDE